jgi:hypothetical protein
VNGAEAAFIIDHAHVARSPAAPVPEHEVARRRIRAGREAGHDDTGDAFIDEPTRQRVSRRRPASIDLILPGGGQLVITQTELYEYRLLCEVQNIFAVHVVGAECQRLRLEGERLLCFQPGGFVVQGCIKGGHAGRIESAAVL